MSLEQRLRENLDAAAKSLVVPEARKPPTRAHATGWSRRMALAGLGAAAALALVIVPVLLVGPEEPGDLGTMAPPVATTSAGTVSQSVRPSSTVPSTTTVAGGTALLGEATTDSHRYQINAERVGDGDMPTATLTLTASTMVDDSAVDEAVIGDPSSFFWHSVSGEGGLCLFTASPTEAGDRVALQVLLSPSLGCSEPYIFELSDGSLEERDPTPEDVARLFVEAWQLGYDPAIAVLATAEAADQVTSLPRPDPMVFAGCEGTAGSVYCTWDGEGAIVVVQVSSVEPMPVVASVGLDPEG